MDFQEWFNTVFADTEEDMLPGAVFYKVELQDAFEAGQRNAPVKLLPEAAAVNKAAQGKSEKGE